MKNNDRVSLDKKIFSFRNCFPIAKLFNIVRHKRWILGETRVKITAFPPFPLLVHSPTNCELYRTLRDSQQFSTLQPTSWAFDYITYANLVLMVHLSRPNGVRRSQAKGKPWSISRNDNVAQIASHGHFFSSIMREISRIPCLFVCISRRACRETERTRRFDWVIWESFSRCKVYIYIYSLKIRVITN